MIPYPAINRGGPLATGYLTVDPLITTPFVGPTGSLFSPYRSPDSSGSVKTVRIVDSGQCSAEVNLQSVVLDQIQAQVKDEFLDGACTEKSDARLHFMNLATYVDNSSPGAFGFSPNLTGGFFLRGIFDVMGHGPIAGGHFCGTALNYRYDLGLAFGPTVGVLSALATQVVYSATSDIICTGGCILGNDVPSVTDKLRTAMERTIPYKIYGGAAALQFRPIPNPVGPGNISCFEGDRYSCQTDNDCDGLGTYQQYCDFSDFDELQRAGLKPLTHGICKTKDPCGPGHIVYADGTVSEEKVLTNSGRVVAAQAVKIGAQLLGMSNAEQDQLQATVNQQDPNGVYRNFACTRDPNGDGSSTPTCKFIVRAKRIVQHPDTAELVFFDSVERDNPAFAVFVATFASGRYLSYRQLCQRKAPRVNTQNFFTRRFATAHVPEASCSDIAPPPPPNCSSDADCINNGQRRCVGGYCGYPACQPGPNGLTECPAGLQCQFDASRHTTCRPPCTSDFQCGSGDSGVCANGSCVKACMTDIDCAEFGDGVAKCVQAPGMPYKECGLTIAASGGGSHCKN